MYEKGAGVEKNYKQADAWYRKAARQGHALAQNNLGSMYYYGKGVEKDYLQAFDWVSDGRTTGNSPKRKPTSCILSTINSLNVVTS